MDEIDFAVLCAEAAEYRGQFARCVPARKPPKPPRWTPEEDEFLRANHGLISEGAIAAELNRTVDAVHIRWARELHLPPPSRHPDYLTAHQAAALLGMDGHKITHFCDTGLIKHRIMAGERKIRLIPRLALFAWACSPANWIYFDWRKIPDSHLRRLCELRAAKWGDEWLSSRQVADMHGVDPTDVHRYIRHGRLPGVQVAVSKSGRHKNPYWRNWFIRRSDAEKVVFENDFSVKFTPRACEWMLRAKALGLTWKQITRSMGDKCHPHTVRKKVLELLAG